MLGVELLLQPTIVWFWPYPTCIFYPQLINRLWLRVKIFLSIYLSIHLSAYEWPSIYLVYSIYLPYLLDSANQPIPSLLTIWAQGTRASLCLSRPESALRHWMSERDCLESEGIPLLPWGMTLKLAYCMSSSLIGRSRCALPALLMHLVRRCNRRPQHTLNLGFHLLDSRFFEEKNGRS